MLPERSALNMAGCTGQNVSPALEWHNAPAGTKSFVITVFDPDEKATPSGWWHWVVYDLPGSISALPQGAGDELHPKIPKGATQGRSDLGNRAYHGACPDKGAPAHRYQFTIYALNVDKLQVPKGPSGAMVTLMASDHVLATATLTARYCHQ